MSSASKLPDRHSIYVSPSGKRCMWIPNEKTTSTWLFFRYLDRTELNGEGFPLSWGNFRFMREHPQQRLPDAAAR